MEDWLWQKYDLESKITDILSAVPRDDQEHHMGKPFLTAYQIAIEFARRHKDDLTSMDLPVGGLGTGQKRSLTQYVARELSRRIKSGHITHIEGRFLSNQHIDDIVFDNDGEIVHYSLTGTRSKLSMFRLCDT